MFQIGDIVKITKNTSGLKSYDRYVGIIDEIEKVDVWSDFQYTLKNYKQGGGWSEEDLELVKAKYK